MCVHAEITEQGSGGHFCSLTYTGGNSGSSASVLLMLEQAPDDHDCFPV